MILKLDGVRNIGVEQQLRVWFRWVWNGMRRVFDAEEGGKDMDGGNGFECGLVWNVFDEERRGIGSGDLIGGDRMGVDQLSPNCPRSIGVSM